MCGYKIMSTVITLFCLIKAVGKICEMSVIIVLSTVYFHVAEKIIAF